MYSYIKDILPKFLDNCFTKNNSRNTHSTRQSKHLHIPNYTYKFSRSSIMYAGPLLWNALPQCITCTTTLSSFKSKYKHYLLNQ